jgi:hypothetical protein
MPDSAYDLATAQLQQWGLGSLAPTLIGYIQQGLSQEEQLLKLRQTNEYKARFAGNEIRRQKGLAVLSEAEYLAKEDALRAQLSDPTYGLPSGFYDSYDDFSKMIGADLGAAEIQSRLESVKAVVTDGRLNGVLQWGKDNYGWTDGDLTALFLDPERAAADLRRKANAATIGAAARRAAYGNIDAAYAERLDALGISADQAASGFSQAASLTGLTAAGDGEMTATKEQIRNAIFEQDAAARAKVEAVQNARRARFQGGGAFAESKEGIAGLRTAGT